MTTPQQSGTWTGWHRPHQRATWRPLAQAPTLALAWDALLAVRPGGGELLVIEAGRDPNREPRSRRR